VRVCVLLISWAFGPLCDTSFVCTLFSHSLSLCSLNQKMLWTRMCCALLGQLLCLITSFSLTDYVLDSIVDFKVDWRRKAFFSSSERHMLPFFFLFIHFTFPFLFLLNIEINQGWTKKRFFLLINNTTLILMLYNGNRIYMLLFFYMIKLIILEGQMVTLYHC
jgi:hypothetical protein